MGMGDFVLCLGAGDRVVRFKVSFSLENAVAVGVLLCMASTLVCAVSLWRSLCSVVSCLNISTNCLIYSSLVSPMAANGTVRYGL